jgi:NAD(P)-dependent dehydrogenase (short-subunit alcohol dehydrogenase family)
MDGKVVLISGGASGIGAGHGRVFAQHGAKVVIGDIDEIGGKAIVDRITANAGEAIFVRLDVTDEASWKNAVAQSIQHFGKLTCLINNAGIYHVGGVEQETREGFDRIISVDQTGVFLGMKTAMPALLKAGSAAIVNISSAWGLIGTGGSIAYHAAKGAVRVMTKTAAIEYARKGVRINSIYPGQIDTPVLAGMDDDVREATANSIPMGRLGSSDEVAYASLFLCSDEASYITGAELSVDGAYYPG